MVMYPSKKFSRESFLEESKFDMSLRDDHDRLRESVSRVSSRQIKTQERVRRTS